MRDTHLRLFKFKCDNKNCVFECFVNRNNNVLTHYTGQTSALLDWLCPECREGHLRYAQNNVRFDFCLIKEEKKVDNKIKFDKMPENFAD